MNISVLKWLLAASLFSAANARETIKKFEIPVDLGVSVDVLSKYAYRGLEFSKGPVLWITPTANYKDLTLIGFGNLDYDSRELNEVNVMLDYTKGLGKALTASLGYGIYFFPNTDLEKTQEVYAGMSLDKLLNPGIKVIWDFDQAEGVYAEASVEHELTGNTVSTALKSNTAYNHEYFSDNSSFSHTELSLSFPFRFTKNFSITPKVSYSKALSKNFKDIPYASLNIDAKF